MQIHVKSYIELEIYTIILLRFEHRTLSYSTLLRYITYDTDTDQSSGFYCSTITITRSLWFGSLKPGSQILNLGTEMHPQPNTETHISSTP